MSYVVTKKGFSRVLFTTDHYGDAVDFISKKSNRAALMIDYKKSERNRYEEFNYEFEKYEITFC